MAIVLSIAHRCRALNKGVPLYMGLSIGAESHTSGIEGVIILPNDYKS